jgi:phosphatidylserine decarboxylase
VRKLFVLQAIPSVAAYLVGRYVGLEFWQIVVFLWVPIFAVGYAWLWWFRNVFFYRDPERSIPHAANVIVSPADGRVMYIRPVKAGEVVSDKKGRQIPISELAKTELAETQGWLVGIYMTPFDVHFSRAPIDGEIEAVHHHRAKLNLPMVDLWEYINFTLLRRAVDMFSAPFHLENERLTLRIRNGKATCFVILIADQFVNKITQFFEDAEHVAMGDKIAFIERGSQTDLFICHEQVSFEIRPGDQVYAGKTALATFDA